MPTPTPYLPVTPSPQASRRGGAALGSVPDGLGVYQIELRTTDDGGCIPKRVAKVAKGGMGKRQLARGNVQHGQIPMYIGTHATQNGMHPATGHSNAPGRHRLGNADAEVDMARNRYYIPDDALPLTEGIMAVR